MVARRTSAASGLTTYTGTGLTDPQAGYVTRVGVAGFLFDPGIPYGTWDLCADDGSRRNTARVNNTAINGTGTLTTINLSGSSGWTSGTCP